MIAKRKMATAPADLGFFMRPGLCATGYSCRAESPSRKPSRDAMKPSVLFSRLFVFSFSALASIATAQTLTLEPHNRVPYAEIQPASDDAQLALKRFSLPAGLKAQL